MHAVTVLHSSRDPFRLDTGANHRDGLWFAERIARLVPHGTVHLRGLHYRIVASANVRKPNGQLYRNTEADWVWLSENASKAARWLGYVPFRRIVDERNEEPEVWETTPIESPWSSLDTTGAIGAIVEPELANVLPRVWGSGFCGQQSHRIVFVGEKSSLAPVLRPLAAACKAS